MGALLYIRFWAALIGVFGSLSGAGAGLAWLVVPTPPVYHRTTYFEFPLPAEWSCDREGTETVCFPRGPEPHSAIIVLAAKWRGPGDTPEAYRDHLRQPQTRVMEDGREITSVVLSLADSRLGDHLWIDARHRDGEIEGFVTRYMAAVTSDIGILVTYSIAEQRLAEFDPQLSRAVEGLDVYQTLPAGPRE